LGLPDLYSGGNAQISGIAFFRSARIRFSQMLTLFFGAWRRLVFVLVALPPPPVTFRAKRGSTCVERLRFSKVDQRL
jgi:hypothetical protein